jgi:hypothetical protein
VRIARIRTSKSSTRSQTYQGLVVLGDVFHAMDCAKVPTKHEAKKTYFVALLEAFLIWNPEKLKELTSKMKESGKQDEEVKLQQYFNKRLFCRCVE